MAEMTQQIPQAFEAKEMLKDEIRSIGTVFLQTYCEQHDQ